jgi:hypothetical protein
VVEPTAQCVREFAGLGGGPDKREVRDALRLAAVQLVVYARERAPFIDGDVE